MSGPDTHKNPATSPQDPGRRRLLKRGAVAAPMVLSLGSGAALARTSNVIRASNVADADGNFYCLEVDQTYTYNGTGEYDLGLYPSQNVYQYPANHTYRTEPNNGSSSLVMTGQEVCETGGVFNYNSGGWKQINVGNGGLLVSNASLTSVGIVTIMDATQVNIDV